MSAGQGGSSGALRRSALGLASALLFVLAVGAASGCAPRTVIRARAGATYEGRFISARAYEAYARGVVAERDGALEAALAAFEEAAVLDPEGPEPLVRAAGVLCATGRPGDADRAEALLDRALELAPSAPRAHLERARCARARSRLEEARAHAELALVFAPDDEETLLLLVELFERAGEASLAEEALVAHCLGRRPSRALAERLLALADAQADAGLRGVAVAALARAPATASARPTRETLARVDEALEAEDLPLARKRAVRAGLSQGELAVRAVALGRPEEARVQAQLVAEASPTDAAAHLAWLLSVGRDAPKDVAPPPTFTPQAGEPPLSPLAELLLYEWLERRLGPALAGPRPAPAPSADDALLAATQARVLGAR